MKTFILSYWPIITTIVFMAVGYGALRQDIQNFHNTSLSLTSELKELRIAVVDMKSFMAAQEERNKRMDSLDHRITKLEERRLNE